MPSRRKRRCRTGEYKGHVRSFREVDLSEPARGHWVRAGFVGTNDEGRG
jgi:hypothetical protein